MIQVKSASQLDAKEIERTKQAYQSTKNITHAAQLLGISRRAMQHRIKYFDFEIDNNEKKNEYFFLGGHPRWHRMLFLKE